MALAILPLPFTATVVVPALLVAGSGASIDLGLGGAAAVLPVVGGAALIAAGLGLFAASVLGGEALALPLPRPSLAAAASAVAPGRRSGMGRAPFGALPLAGL